MEHILRAINLLSKALQVKDQNILKAVSMINGTKVNILCTKYDIEVLKIDEACADKTNRIFDITNRHYFEIDIFNTVLDMQIQEFGDRFSEISTHLLSSMSALSPRALSSIFDASKLITLTTYIRMILWILICYIIYGNLTYDVVQNEDFSKLNTITELAKEIVRLDKHSTFPMIYKLLKLALVLPVATAIVERCFSTMKLIKSDLCNRMGDRFLNHVLVCSLEKEIFINVKTEDIMKRFQSREDRKGKLI
nr:hypothetical protein [Tanacetum cinerariifolium]